MIHMHAVPASPNLSQPAVQPRMVYLTNSEVDNTGKVRAIHSHADITEIGLVYHGHGIHSIGGREYHSEPGDLLLYNTNVLHQDLAQSGETMRFLLCGATNLRLNGLPPGSIVPGDSDFLLKSGAYFDFILHGFTAVEHSLKTRQPYAASLAHGFLQSLLAAIGNLTDRSGKYPADAQPDRLSLVEEMRRYIDQNFTQNFSLEDLADVFHINRFYASHAFSQSFGSSPMQYRTRRRLGEAHSLLTGTDFSITYIASMVGYDDPNRFSQVFSKIVGMSPSKYRDLSVRFQQPFKREQ